MNNDLISRSELTNLILDSHPEDLQQSDINFLAGDIKVSLKFILNIINNAPTVKTNEMTQDLINKINVNIGLAQPIKDERPQDELAEKLKDRIEKSVCKRCPMKNNCVLCEISRVFQIITLTAEEQKGGKE